MGCMNSPSLPAPPTAFPNQNRSANDGFRPEATPLAEAPDRVAARNQPNLRENAGEGRWKPTGPVRAWKYIVLHHTASEAGSVASIHAAHRQRKDKSGQPWLGIGYHFVIGNGHGMRDGEVQSTFRWKKQLHGAHAGVNEYNQRGIGIVLVGNFEKRSPTTAQISAARRLVNTLRTTYHIDTANIVPHGAISKTACPGRHFSLARITGLDGESLVDSSTSSDSFPLTTATRWDAQ